MKGSRYYFVLALILIPLLASAQGTGASPGTSGQAAAPPSAEATGGATAASQAIKILSPKIDEKIGASAITVRYQLTSGAASADPSPTYRLQLDSRDPVETTSTEHSFTGLAAGDHTITIDVVDANHTPVPQSHTQVQFKTFTPGPNPNQQTGALKAPSVVKASLPLPGTNNLGELPSAGGELPLLSMIGFGVLVGGVISAMRTRR